MIAQGDLNKIIRYALGSAFAIVIAFVAALAISTILEIELIDESYASIN